MVGAFTYVDLAFLAFALIAIIVGLCKGFFAQLFEFAGIVAAILIAFFVCKPLTDKMLPVFAPLIEKAGETLGYYAALAIVFVVLMLIVNILLFLLKKLTKGLVGKVGAVKVVDKILGLALSVGILYTIFAAVLALITLLPSDFLPDVQTTINNQLYGGTVVKAIYTSNPLGSWLLSLLGK